MEIPSLSIKPKMILVELNSANSTRPELEMHHHYQHQLIVRYLKNTNAKLWSKFFTKSSRTTASEPLADLHVLKLPFCLVLNVTLLLKILGIE